MNTTVKKKCPRCGREVEVMFIEGDLVYRPQEEPIQIPTDCPYCGAELKFKKFFDVNN